MTLSQILLYAITGLIAGAIPVLIRMGFRKWRKADVARTAAIAFSVIASDLCDGCRCGCGRQIRYDRDVDVYFIDVNPSKTHSETTRSCVFNFLVTSAATK